MIENRRVWGIDAEALAIALITAGEQVEHPVSLTRIGKGQSNLVLSATDRAGSSWVLRRPPLGQLLQTAHDVVREHRILSALQSTDVPVPQLVGRGLIQDAPVCDGPCLVMRHVEGTVIDEDAAADALSTGARRRLAEAIIDAMVKLHHVEPAEVGLGELAADAPYAHRQLRRWARQWEQSKPGGAHPLDGLTRRLTRAVPTTEERRIVHGDLHPRNVMIDQSGNVRAVLDWELATLGDPSADLGTLLAYWPESGDPDTIIFGATRLDGFPSRAELISLYRQRSGRSAEAIEFWHVLGLWKVAIIVQGILRRTEAEPRNRAEGAPTQQAQVDAIADLAIGQADRYGL